MDKKKTTPTKEKAVKEAPQATPKSEPVPKTPKVAITQTPKAETQTQAQSQTVSSAPAQTEKSAKDFTAYLLPDAVFDEEMAVGALRAKLRAYKEIHAGFLAKTEEKDAFVLKREYIPVYRQKATVDYLWSVANKGENIEHSERREISCQQHTAPKFFQADSLPVGCAFKTLAKAKGKDELYPCKQKKFSACAKALKKEAKAYAPQKGAKVQLSACAYEVVYVPVLKAICTFEGKEYVGYVNMLNGECEAQYRVSERLLKKADKAIAGVRFSRRLILFSLIYALSFAGVAWYFAQKTEAMDRLLVMVVGMSCAVIVPVLCYVFCFSYKRDKFILKAVHTGKMPKAILARVFSVLCLLVAVGEVLSFILYVL